jgi:hypothetical protein
MKLSKKIYSSVDERYEDTSPKTHTCSACGKTVTQYYHDVPRMKMIHGKIYCIKCAELREKIIEKTLNDNKDLIAYAEELLKKYPGHLILKELLDKLQYHKALNYDARKFHRLIDDSDTFTLDEKNKLSALLFEPFKQKDVLYVSTRRKRK